VSGRGVGLDIVETAVEQVGGELRVSSMLGAGTTFEIRLPVTFGLLSATVLVANGNRYCIPSDQVLHIGAAVREKTRSKKDQSHNDDEPMNLSELLGQSPKQKRSRKSAQQVTCRLYESQQQANGHSRKVRLIVDGVEGTEEVLVRTLGRHSGRWYGVAGATELRDGSVALVLDLPRLLSNS
jgi:chemotaxis protein histidine kinase CheA